MYVYVQVYLHVPAVVWPSSVLTHSLGGLGSEHRVMVTSSYYPHSPQGGCWKLTPQHNQSIQRQQLNVGVTCSVGPE